MEKRGDRARKRATFTGQPTERLGVA